MDLVIKVAENFVCFQMPEVFSCLSEKLPLSQNYVTSEGFVSNNVLYYNSYLLLVTK